MKQVELVNGDLRFPALMAGSGEPVILLHGFPDTHENWAVQINALAEAGYTAIAPALRGYAPGCQSGSGDYSRAAMPRAASPEAAIILCMPQWTT